MTQFSTFRLGERIFGLDILLVREIVRMPRITEVPTAKPHIRGLINLRGQIVTILDLAVRLGHPPAELTPSSHVVVLKTHQELTVIQRPGKDAEASTSEDLVGFLVDDIDDVIEADASLIRPTAANVDETTGRFLLGVIKTEAKLLSILNLKNVLQNE